MPTYSYRAVNEDGKEVTGSLDAPDTLAAKSAIEALHLELIDLTEAMRLRKPQASAGSGMTTFMFEGQDALGSFHRGSVQASTKREAFDNLKKSQEIHLSVLSPVGSTPAAYDQDLVAWQLPSTAAVQASTDAMPLQKIAAQSKNTDSSAFVTLPEDVTPKSSASSTMNHPTDAIAETKYASIFSTLRLYAGWLLAWYGLFIACGYYSIQRQLPFDIPAAEGFFYSPLIISFILAIFLYLALHSIHRALSGTFILGGALAVVGVILFVFLRTSLVS